MTLVATTAGCGGSSLRTLTWDDVTGLPSGNATGTKFTGEYLATSNRLLECRCRVGNCAELTPTVGGTLQITQADGRFGLGTGTGAVVEGGVDDDGKFWIGYAVEEVGNVQYAILNGKFSLSGGLPTSMQGIQEATGNTGTIDCDIKSSFTARYVGPLPAAFVAIAPPGTEAPVVTHPGLGLVGVNLR
jgi:hypothetical protein